jgi:hypothetical protein
MFWVKRNLHLFPATLLSLIIPLAVETVFCPKIVQGKTSTDLIKVIRAKETFTFKNNSDMIIAENSLTPIQGRLDSNSQKLDDNTYYNIHTFEGIQGETITIELNSTEFDPFLLKSIVG